MQISTWHIISAQQMLAIIISMSYYVAIGLYQVLQETGGEIRPGPVTRVLVVNGQV